MRLTIKTLIISFSLLLMACPNLVFAAKFGWITDIHAGNSKQRKQTERNVVYPKKYKTYFKQVLGKLKNAGITKVIATGDNTNRGEKKYMRSLVKIADKKNMKIIWVKGNHDTDRAMKRYAPKYYYRDTGGVRVIVLNNASDQIDSTQLKWFIKTLDASTLPVIVAAHMRIHDGENVIPHPGYAEVNEAIMNSGKVEYVLTGHAHQESQYDVNGVAYWTGNPLTLKGHMGSYYKISL